MYTLKGTIKVIGKTQHVSDSFKKRELVITDSKGQYEQHIQLQLVQDRCELVDRFKVGEEVEVTFFLNGKEWTNPKDGQVRYFNSLDAWKIDYAGKHADEIQGAKHEAETFVAEGDDDLPF